MGTIPPSSPADRELELLEAHPSVSRAAPFPHIPEKKTLHQEVPQDLKDKVMPAWFLLLFFFYIFSVFLTHLFLLWQELGGHQDESEPPQTPHCPAERSKPTYKPSTAASQPSKALHTTLSPHSASKQQNLGEMQSPVCPEMFLPAPSPPPFVSEGISRSVWFLAAFSQHKPRARDVGCHWSAAAEEIWVGKELFGTGADRNSSDYLKRVI